MKKITAFLLILTMVLVMTACGKDASSDTYVSENGTESGSGEADVTSASDVTVGFIFVGPVGDGGWSFSHNEGRLALESELGVKTLYKESVPESQEVEGEIRNMIDQGASIIFATSYGYMNYVEELSKEFPDVKFFHCSGYKQTDNMSNYFGRIYEARYLSGIVAGLKSETNHIGYVGAFPIPEVVRGINAFTLGARSVNPDVEVEVVWTSTWYDPAIEKEAAIALLDSGADIIAQHQDTGGPQQAAEERGLYSIGYHTDMSAIAPNAVLTSVVWNWNDYYVDQVKSVIDGEFESESYWGGMETGMVGLTDVADFAADGTQEALDAAIADGMHVFTGEIKDQEGNVKVADGETLTDDELLNMLWFVEGVIGKIQ
jgi:basic membrane protein A